MIRLSYEVRHRTIDQIEDNIEFELLMYKAIPELLERTYESYDYLLEYMLKVKSFSRYIDKTRNTIKSV